MASFVPLQVISSYSLLRSTLRIPELISAAKKAGYQALALCDRDVMYGTIPFYDLCQAQGIKPLLGLTLTMRGILSPRTFEIILIAQNQTGYHNLMKLSTLAKTSQQPVTWGDIKPYLAGLYIIHPLKQELAQNLMQRNVQAAERIIKQIAAVVPLTAIKIGIASNQNLQERQIMQKFASQNKIKLVALAPVKYLQSNDAFYLHVLKTIANDQTITSPVKSFQNHQLGQAWLKPAANQDQSFAAVGLKAAVKETRLIADNCHVVLKKRQAGLPHFFDQKEKESGHGQSSKTYLQFLSRRGLEERLQVQDWKAVPSTYQHRLKRELKVISQMGFDDYFLIVWDIMHFIRNHHFTTGDGRGSAAGALVSYALFITNVDPLKHHLLFERFLNPERAEMPDIDLDIPDVDRSQVLQYVHQKYQDPEPGAQGNPLKERVSQIITFDTMAAKQSLRDVGRSFGLNATQLNQWSKAVPSVPKISLRTAYHQSKALQQLCLTGTDLNPSLHLNQLLFKTALHLENLPRHFSTHAAGLIVSEHPIVNLSPLQSGNENLLMTQYSKSYAIGAGLLKIDFLGLRNLTLLGQVLRSVKKNFDHNFNIDEINFNDPKTLELFQKGDTDGVFQFESSGIKQALRKVHPTSFALVAMVNALYRPGPLQNIPMFIKRKNGQEKVTYPDAALKKILAPTYGIIIYQEQVMLVAQIMGGFTLGQADILRRAMSKKKHHMMASLRIKFIRGALKKGFSKQTADQTFAYMNRFASYGFNKSHAVAYSKLAFKLAYLKVHFSTAFFSALLNSVSGNVNKIKRYLMDARELGVQILAPDVNLSGRECSVDHQHLRLGLNFLRGISSELVNNLIQHRQKPYPDLNHFMIGICHYLEMFAKAERRPNQPQTTIKLLGENDPTPALFPLIYSGALDSIARFDQTDQQKIPRYEIRSACYHIFRAINGNYQRYSQNHDQQDEAKLEEQLAQGVKIFEQFKPKLKPDEYTDPLSLRRRVYHYLNLNELDLFTPLKKALNSVPIKELAAIPGNVTILVSIMKYHEIRTKKGQLMAFLTLSDGVDQVDSVVFPSIYQRFHNFIKRNLVVIIRGKIEKRQGIQVVVDYLEPAANVWHRVMQHQKNSGSVYNWKQHCCYLRIKDHQRDAQKLSRLKSLISSHPGNYPIMIFETASNRKYLLSKNYAIQKSRVIENLLSQIFGQQNVVFK